MNDPFEPITNDTNRVDKARDDLEKNKKNLERIKELRKRNLSKGQKKELERLYNYTTQQISEYERYLAQIDKESQNKKRLTSSLDTSKKNIFQNLNEESLNNNKKTAHEINPGSKKDEQIAFDSIFPTVKSYNDTKIKEEYVKFMDVIKNTVGDYETTNSDDDVYDLEPESKISTIPHLYTDLSGEDQYYQSFDQIFDNKGKLPKKDVSNVGGYDNFYERNDAEMLKVHNSRPYIGSNEEWEKYSQQFEAEEREREKNKRIKIISTDDSRIIINMDKLLEKAQGFFVSIANKFGPNHNEYSDISSMGGRNL